MAHCLVGQKHKPLFHEHRPLYRERTGAKRIALVLKFKPRMHWTQSNQEPNEPITSYMNIITRYVTKNIQHGANYVTKLLPGI